VFRVQKFVLVTTGHPLLAGPGRFEFTLATRAGAAGAPTCIRCEADRTSRRTKTARQACESGPPRLAQCIQRANKKLHVHRLHTIVVLEIVRLTDTDVEALNDHGLVFLVDADDSESD